MSFLYKKFTKKARGLRKRYFVYTFFAMFSGALVLTLSGVGYWIAVSVLLNIFITPLKLIIFRFSLLAGVVAWAIFVYPNLKIRNFFIKISRKEKIDSAQFITAYEYENFPEFCSGDSKMFELAVLQAQNRLVLFDNMLNRWRNRIIVLLTLALLLLISILLGKKIIGKENKKKIIDYKLLKQVNLSVKPPDYTKIKPYILKNSKCDFFLP